MLGDDITDEEIAEARRLDRLYTGLSENEAFYIVQRWDRSNDLESPDRRLNNKAEAPDRARRKTFLIVAGVITALLFLWWHGGYVREYHQGQAALYVLDRMKERSQKEAPELKAAIAQAEREYGDYLETLRDDEYEY